MTAHDPVEALSRKRNALRIADDERDICDAGRGSVLLREANELRFEVDTNRAVVLAPGADPEELPLMSKLRLADAILDRVAVRLGRSDPTTDQESDQ